MLRALSLSPFPLLLACTAKCLRFSLNFPVFSFVRSSLLASVVSLLSILFYHLWIWLNWGGRMLRYYSSFLLNPDQVNSENGSRGRKRKKKVVGRSRPFILTTKVSSKPLTVLNWVVGVFLPYLLEKAFSNSFFWRFWFSGNKNYDPRRMRWN